MSTWVFFSVGRTFNDEQEAFVEAMEAFLEANGLTPRTVGRNYFSNQQPLKSVAELMRECSGAVILALERMHLKEAVEKRGSPQEKWLQSVNLPTVWNQIEGSMAYALGLPLLVVVEHDIRSEGLLETGYDWYLNWITLDQPVFRDRQFLGVFNDWKEHVLAFHDERQRREEARRAAGEGAPDLLAEARRALKACRLFETQRELAALFVDGRIRPFRNRLHEAHSYGERIDMVIDRLYDQHNTDGENALGLFLQVLSERVEEGDACRQRLADLAWQLELRRG